MQKKNNFKYNLNLGKMLEYIYFFSSTITIYFDINKKLKNGTDSSDCKWVLT